MQARLPLHFLLQPWPPSSSFASFMNKLTYKDAGVDIEAGDRFVSEIKPLTERTSRPEVLGGIGGFGGLFALPTDRYQSPVLVAGTDGVGTKLKLAFEMDQHHTVGIDLVAMCVNDIVVSGAEPLFFLDYYATGKLEPSVGRAVVEGIAEGCVQAGCALLGGETAEMPGFYAKGEYDLAGFAVGIVEREAIIDGGRVSAGDKVIGIPSSGLHSNGFSLARKVIEVLGLNLEETREDLEGISVGHALLEPTRIYARAVRNILQEVPINAVAHITGGGIPGNLARALPPNLAAFLDASAWDKAPIFDLLAKAGIPVYEQYKTFNMGLGMIIVISAPHAQSAIEILNDMGEKAVVIGEIGQRNEGPAVSIESTGEGGEQP